MLVQRSFPTRVGMMVATLAGLAFANSAKAAESIIVRYKSEEATITRQDLNTFADTGEIPAGLQKLIKDDVQAPDIVQTLLTEKIKIPKFVERFIKGSNGDFLLLKLDEAISSSSGSTERDLKDIRTAILDSIADNQVSFIELIAKHPQTQIRLDLTSLEGTYQDVRGFVERVLPAIEVAKGVLQDLVCDCDAQQTASGLEAEPAAGQPYQSTKWTADNPNLPTKNCNLHKDEKAALIEPE